MRARNQQEHGPAGMGQPCSWGCKHRTKHFHLQLSAVQCFLEVLSNLDKPMIPLQGLPGLYLLTFREQWSVHLFLQTLLTTIMKQMYCYILKCRAKTVGWPANVDHFFFLCLPCGLQRANRKKTENNSMHKTRNCNNESNKQRLENPIDTPSNSKFNSTPIQTKPFWEYKKQNRTFNYTNV